MNSSGNSNSKNVFDLDLGQLAANAKGKTSDKVRRMSSRKVNKSVKSFRAGDSLTSKKRSS